MIPELKYDDNELREEDQYDPDFYYKRQREEKDLW